MKKRFVIGLIAASIVTLLGTLRVATNAIERRIPEMETHSPHQGVRGGTISGFVVDTEGKPVSQATVSIRTGSLMGIVRPARADKNGAFTITGLAAGTYRLWATKEEDGYAETLSTFYVGAKPIIQQITLNEDEASSGNLIRLGPKALKLFGRVVDAVTKKPVGSVRLTLRRVDDPGAFLEQGLDASGSFRVLVPRVPITFEVSAPGYEGRNLGTLKLKTGEAINKLEVTLRKSQ